MRLHELQVDPKDLRPIRPLKNKALFLHTHDWHIPPHSHVRSPVAQLSSLQIQAGISTTLGPFAPIAEKL